ncbi:isopentenyl-diphosphate delta-isomerase [Quadrisphaera granulorum]|uniref:Isopentenyl-diphosphate Delta-isomerase n=1 Tax=Quadrisphaera granulorum TaxID=317664 RepID=A0A316AF59_9ACTN|nr:isopentenyl-diphosphate Delta-isomerase [Quadrisphaera granulorum]PWJ56212.1 isopentenyl-diphosphate delta-isomerase [Quadrisphaera granulorum]SZE94846.1 isopentenyl-diphosphate delta-isomerase [Quadrisphaera granulorum]
MTTSLAAPGAQTAAPELVVLLDDERRPVGSTPKVAVHTADTPLHLAFSCYISDTRGRLLLTRRAVTKLTWPGVWTNSVCGHPAPGEAFDDAVRRRARQELGLEIRDLTERLPDFAYRAVDASGVVENEFCPVFTAVADADPVPDPDEVAEWAWVEWDDAVTLAARTPFAISPWAVLQLGQLSQVLDLSRGVAR